LISTTQRRELELFEGDWGEHPEGGVAALAVVGRLDVLKHRGLQLSRVGQLRRWTSSFLSVAKNVSATAFAFAVDCA
jgi:hypothetical protein